jgi:hypothetical protein
MAGVSTPIKQPVKQPSSVITYCLKRASETKTGRLLTFPLFLMEYISKLTIHFFQRDYRDFKVMKLVRCPECGEPLARSKDHRYYCQNEGCSVIYVKYPYQPAVSKVVRTSLSNGEKERDLA